MHLYEPIWNSGKSPPSHSGYTFESHPHGDDMKFVSPEEIIKGMSIERKERSHGHDPGSPAEHSETSNHSPASPEQPHRTHPGGLN